MSGDSIVYIIHLLGFLTGIALYGMLAVMVHQQGRGAAAVPGRSIQILAAVLGLVWNAGALLAFGIGGSMAGAPWIAAIAYAALGFLPAVVVDSATRSAARPGRPTWLAIFAYALSAIATVLQFTAASTGEFSTAAVLTLSIGSAAILAALLTGARWRGERSHRTLTTVTLAVFAVSALHLTHHGSGVDAWYVELIGDHASLALVLVILYQDYRFALADIFLKRALTMVGTVAVAAALYALLLSPVVGAGRGVADPRLPAMAIVLAVITASISPWLRRGIHRFVDRVVLGRSDYREARAAVARRISAGATADEVLQEAADALGATMSAEYAIWRPLPFMADGATGRSLVAADGNGATVDVPTAEPPHYTIALNGVAGGRRLLSDDVALLDATALLAARRIDEIRVADERLQRDLREHEMRRLASEAELQALRAQLNPHFLFNALTAIAQLIRTSPSRALDTLYQLTSLLRSVLRRVDGEFVPLRDELHLVDAYLAIERARFEERLQVERDVDRDAEGIQVPPLVLQPLVENAIKHAIAPSRRGGTVRITVRLERHRITHEEVVRMEVADSGAASSPGDVASWLSRGVGLANIKRRLERYYGDRGSLVIIPTPGIGTVATVIVPVSAQASDPAEDEERECIARV